MDDVRDAGGTGHSGQVFRCSFPDVGCLRCGDGEFYILPATREGFWAQNAPRPNFFKSSLWLAHGAGTHRALRDRTAREGREADRDHQERDVEDNVIDFPGSGKGGGGGPADLMLAPCVAALGQAFAKIEFEIDRSETALRRIEDAPKPVADDNRNFAEQDAELAAQVALIDGRLTKVPTFGRRLRFSQPC